ncbi:hypothetical protein [Eubacterium ruminantium]|nr:hypothetical protein [Eubacterium ruminantium]
MKHRVMYCGFDCCKDQVRCSFVILEVGTMLMKHIMVVGDLKKLYTD